MYRDSPLNEIDVEMLTRENRFDWHPDSVNYFIDGVPAGKLSNQVPDMDAAIMLNHWSGNIAGWGGAAPTVDMYMYVDQMIYSSDFSTDLFVPPKRASIQPNAAWLNAAGIVLAISPNPSGQMRMRAFSLNGRLLIGE